MDNETRAYKSPLREKRAAQTKGRILDAVFEVMGRGVAELTMPAVAKAAGVSLPTVYRYFPDKPALVEAAAGRARERIGVRMDPAPDLAALLSRVRHVGEQLGDAGAVLQVLTAAMLQGPYPAESQAGRRKALLGTLREELAGVKGRDRKMAVDWVMMLASSPMIGVLARFNFAGGERTERVVWAIETLLIGVRERQRRQREGE